MIYFPSVRNIENNTQAMLSFQMFFEGLMCNICKDLMVEQ